VSGGKRGAEADCLADGLWGKETSGTPAFSRYNGVDRLFVDWQSFSTTLSTNMPILVEFAA